MKEREQGIGNGEQERIIAALHEIESTHGCRILFAVESGSRAWGFASPDSDYDVRAVYARPLDWYLGLEENPPDTWNRQMPGDLDISAWDLRKALRHALKGNPAFLEWLGSPIVYRDDGMIGEIARMAATVFNPAHAAYHYASLFRHAIEDRGPDGTVGVKKLCYALRASLCVQWIFKRETMPPTAFADVVAGVSLADAQRDAISRLLALKAATSEKARTIPEPALSALLEDRYDEVRNHSWRSPPDEAVATARAGLERLFTECVKGDGTLEKGR
jgi:predicted nucleotidyltransferase